MTDSPSIPAGGPDRRHGPRNALRRDLSYAFLGQTTVLTVSVIRTFLVPFMLGPDLLTYSQWQTYLLYLGYISLAFLGFNDGLYVRHARRSVDDVRASLSSALMVYSAVLMAEAILVCGVVLALPLSDTDSLIWTAIVANVPLAGVYGALLYHLQLSGKIDKASVVVAVEKLLFLLLACLAWAAGELAFVPLLLADVGAKVFVVGHVLLTERRTVLARNARWSQGVHELALNIRVGVKIMLGAYCAMLLSGATRIAAQLFQGPLTFAYFAFAFSVTGIVLLAGQAVAVVIYPRMARLSREGLGQLLPALDRAVESLFPVVLVGFFPLVALIDAGLPQYSPSRDFLSLLLAVGALQLVVSTINNSYYRLLRLENRMLMDNALTLGLFIPVCILLRNHLEWMLGAQLLMLTVRVSLSQRLFNNRLGLRQSWAPFRYLAWTGVFLAVVALATWWAVTIFVVVLCCNLLRERRRSLARVADLLTSGS